MKKQFLLLITFTLFWAFIICFTNCNLQTPKCQTNTEASFPGGDEALLVFIDSLHDINTFIAEDSRYSSDKKITKLVVFEIDTNGTIKNWHCVDTLYDMYVKKEISSIISKMPKWKPKVFFDSQTHSCKPQPGYGWFSLDYYFACCVPKTKDSLLVRNCSFPGGLWALQEFLQANQDSNYRLPDSLNHFCDSSMMQLCEVSIDTNGDLQFLGYANNCYDAYSYHEIFTIANKMPKFTPALVYNKKTRKSMKIKQHYTINFCFKYEQTERLKKCRQEREPEIANPLIKEED